MMPTTTQTPVTLKDLRASERRIARAQRAVAKLSMALTVAEQAVEAERERHAALVAEYGQQA